MADEYIQDPALLERLKTPQTETKSEYIQDPALLERIQGSTEPTQPVAQARDIGVGELASPAATGAAYAIESGYNPQAVRQVAAPLKQAIPATFQTYMREPIKAAVDVAVPMATGGIVPPPYATTEGAKGLYKAYGAAKESVNEMSRLASQFADKADVGKYLKLWSAADSVDPGIGAKISDIYRNQGGANAVANWLRTSQEGQQFLTNPKTAQLAEQYLGAVPGKLAQAGKVLKPIAVGAARVAGPVGLAYDIYEASPYLNAAQIGPNTASGQVNQMMQAAKQAQLNAPTPAPLTPQEAQNLLASGDQRTINIYGGPEALTRIAQGQTDVMTQPPVAANFLGRIRELGKRYKTAGVQ